MRRSRSAASATVYCRIEAMKTERLIAKSKTKLGMRTETNKLKSVVAMPIDHQEVRLEVAVAMVHPLANKCMVAIAGFESLSRQEGI